MGTAARLQSVHPAGALSVGGLAGAISTVGFNKIQPVLAEWDLYDTCGVHNLRGMRGLLGGVASAFFVFNAPGSNNYEHEHGAAFGRAAIQLICYATTLGVALAPGTIVGAILTTFDKPALPYVDAIA